MTKTPVTPAGWEQMPLGRRVAQLRRDRRISQPVLAGLIGKSLSWLEKVERGQRALDRLSSIYDIATALGVDPQLLLDAPERGPATPAAAAHAPAAAPRPEWGSARRDIEVLMRHHLPPDLAHAGHADWLRNLLVATWVAMAAEGIDLPARARVIATTCAGLAQRPDADRGNGQDPPPQATRR